MMLSLDRAPPSSSKSGCSWSLASETGENGRGESRLAGDIHPCALSFPVVALWEAAALDSASGAPR